MSSFDVSRVNSYFFAIQRRCKSPNSFNLDSLDDDRSKPKSDGNLRFLGLSIFRGSTSTNRVLRRPLTVTFLIPPPCLNAMKYLPFLKVKNPFCSCTVKMDLV